MSGETEGLAYTSQLNHSGIDATGAHRRRQQGDKEGRLKKNKFLLGEP
jgi:hypothetical protein